MKHSSAPLSKVTVSLLSIAFAGSAAAQVFPSKPIRMVVPFPPGASADTIGRIMAAKLSESLGQPVIVDNRPGAGGTIGADAVAKAPPDGHTLLVGSVASIGTAAALYKNLPYDPLKDFAPITSVVRTASLLVVHPSMPVKSVRDLIALAKSRPGELTYSSASNGSPSHLGMELLKTMAGIDMVHVPFKGPQEALTQVLAGHLHLSMQASVSSLPFVTAGRLRALATSGKERLRELPQVPTVSEAALPGYSVYAWFGMLTTSGTPAPVVARLNKEMVRLAHLPDVATKLVAQGGEVATATPEDYAKFIREEVDKWGRVIKLSGARVD